MTTPKIPSTFLDILTDPAARDAFSRYPSGDPFDGKAYEWAASVKSVNPISLDEVAAMHAALAAMVVDSHAPQEHLTAAQWIAAEALFKRVDAWMNKPTEKRKPSQKAAIAKTLRAHGIDAKATRRGVTVTAKGPAKCKRGKR